MSTSKKNLFKYLPKTDQKPIESRITPENNLPTPDPISAEMTHLRSQLADVMSEIKTMSWGKSTKRKRTKP
jgi:hypothetical protein